ncbi:hypothetical protein BH11MYX2_BH11MYX2_00500 [soil metagenome]
MLRRTIFAAVLVASTAAYADKKLQGLTPGLTKESAACGIELRGLNKILTGANDLSATLTGSDKDDLAKDLAPLDAANAQVNTWCYELDGIVSFLTTNADASYKSVSKELDERYRKVATARKAAKKALATYTDKSSTASATSRAFDAGSCEKERAALEDKTNDAIADLEPPATAKELGVDWSVRLSTRGVRAHSLLVMCVGTKTGGVIATGDILPATNKVLAAEITKLMVDMLAVQLAPKK